MDHTPPGNPAKVGPRPFSALYSRDFRLFWVGQLISFSGTWMHSTAQGWLVYSLTKSPLYMGLVAAASSLPVLLFSLIGGAVADRFRKRNVLLLTQGLSMLPALAIGVLTSMGVITVWHVMALVFSLGIINAFDIPTRQAFLIEMVERGHLLNAIALNSAAFNAARIIGPVMAGMAIANLGVAACFYLNALSFLPVIAALSLMRSRGEARTGGGSLFGDISEGVRFVRGEPLALMPVLLVASFSIFGMPFVTLLPVFAGEVLNVGAKGLGFLAGAAGAGAFTAALIIAFGAVKRERALMAASSMVFPAALFAFSVSGDFRFSMAALAVVGWAAVSLLALANSTIQHCAPDALRGRVMSFYTVVFLGMAPLGNFLMGAVADLIGTPQAVSLASTLCLIASIIIFMVFGGKSPEGRG